MIVINPTKETIEVQIEGMVYSVPGEGQITGVRAEHALHWKTRLHQFITLKEEGKVSEKAKVVEEVIKEVEDTSKKTKTK